MNVYQPTKKHLAANGRAFDQGTGRVETGEQGTR